MLGYNDRLNRDDLIAKKEFIEVQMEITHYKLSIDNIMKDVKLQNEADHSPDSMAFLKDLDDGQLEMIARATAQANKNNESSYQYILMS